MVASKNTIEMNIDGTDVLIHPLYGSVMDLDQENYNKYKNILAGGDRYPDEALILQQQGFIVENTEQDMAMADSVCRAIKTGSMECHLTIMTTTACNMQCVYCFEHLRPVFPSEQCEDDIIAFLRRRYEITSFRKLHVTWFGGEPLLNTDYIRRLSKEMIAYAEKNHIVYEADMITNGILFTKDIVREAVKYWRLSSAQITLDGMKHTHNQRRPYGDKDGFSLIMNNILQTCGEIEITIRINVDKKNIKDTENLLIYLSAYDIIKNNVRIAFGRVIDNEPTCMNMSDFDRTERRMRDLLERYRFNHTTQAYSLQGSPVGCGALTDSVFVISPTGDLYKCMETVGDPSYCMGNIRDSDGSGRNIIAEKYHTNEKCVKCNKHLLCNTRICPLHHHESSNSCHYSDEMIADLVRRIRRVENDELNHQQVVA